MADQTNKISAFKGELDRIKALLKRGNLRTGEAQQLLRRGRELENAIQDLNLNIVPPSQTASGEAPNSWGTDQPEEPVEVEDDDEIEEAEGEVNDAATEEVAAATGEANKEEVAKEIESGIEKNEAEKGFDANTAAGQKAAAEAEKAKAAGGPVDPTKAQSGTPVPPPTPGPTESALPGGAAISAGTTPPAEGGAATGTKAATPKPAEENAQGTSGTGSLSDRAKQLGAQIQTGIKDGVNNAKEKLKKQLSKEAMKALLKSPVFWWVVGGIVGLALIAGIAFAIFGSLWGTGNSGSNGATYTQAVDPIKDKDWLSKLLEYSGDKEIKDEKSKEEIAIVRKALTDIQADMTVSEKVRGQATTALADLALYENSPGLAKAGLATKVLADIKAITDQYYACDQLFTKTTTNSFFYINSVDLNPLQKTGRLGAGMPPAALSPRLCGLLASIADPKTLGIDTSKYPVIKMTFRGSHNEFVKVNGKVTTGTSSHYCGNGVDITPGPSSGLTVKQLSDLIEKWLWTNEATLKQNNLFPEEVFGPGPDYTSNINNFARYTKPNKDFGPGYIAGHETHVHIGFGGCKK